MKDQERKLARLLDKKPVKPVGDCGEKPSDPLTNC